MAKYNVVPKCRFVIDGRKPCERCNSVEQYSKEAEACLFREPRAKIRTALGIDEDAEKMLNVTTEHCVSKRDWKSPEVAAEVALTA